jgi:hypothetical protein
VIAQHSAHVDSSIGEIAEIQLVHSPSDEYKWFDSSSSDDWLFSAPMARGMLEAELGGGI